MSIDSGPASPRAVRLLAPRSPYSDAYVARVKALLGVMTVKGVCRITGLPELIVRDWKTGKRRASVQPDRELLPVIAELLAAAD